MAEPDYVANNRENWTKSNADYTDGRAREAWAQEEIAYGQWQAPESEVRILPDVVGKDVVDLGCGTGYFCAWLKRAGARRVVGIDVTPAQLETARRMDDEFGFGIEFLEENAEQTSLPDDSFDVVFSEYGASIWCDTRKWIAEATRLLRPRGELFFLRGSTLRNICAPLDGDGMVEERLVLPQKGLYRLDWKEDDAEGTEFHPPTAEMFQILRENNFELTDFRELYAPEDGETHEYYSNIPAEWAKKWPAEEIWRARLRS